MDASDGSELGAFLRSRRDRLTPADVGVESFGRRRVQGLRREELAQLAGVSATYYTRLEQGIASNASDAVIESLARALQLDGDERAHLFTLARPGSPARVKRARTERPHAGALQLLHAMDTVPAVLLGVRNDILGWNRLGHLLTAGHIDARAPEELVTRPNQLRMLFLDEHTIALHRDWETEAALAVSSMRYVAAQFPGDRLLAELIGELSLGSAVFARLWARQSVQLCTSGERRFAHPAVGELELHYEVLHLPEGHGQRIITYTAAPGTGSAAALTLLSAS